MQNIAFIAYTCIWAN